MTTYWKHTSGSIVAIEDSTLYEANPEEWTESTALEYQAAYDAIPNPVHDDVHTFLDGAGIVDVGTRAAFHRLFGVGH